MNTPSPRETRDFNDFHAQRDDSYAQRPFRWYLASAAVGIVIAGFAPLLPDITRLLFSAIIFAALAINLAWLSLWNARSTGRWLRLTHLSLIPLYAIVGGLLLDGFDPATWTFAPARPSIVRPLRNEAGAVSGAAAILLLLVVVPPIARFLKLCRAERIYYAPGFCPECNCDLKGNTTGICPECGLKFVHEPSEYNG